jgi:hypothetical protein
MLSSAASAQVTGVVGGRTVTGDRIGPIGVSGAPGDSAFEIGSGSTSEEVEYYQVSADVTPTEISFANATTTQGYFASTSATTSVTVTYTNNSAAPVTPTLQSTILPGGFGLYEGNPAGNPVATGFGVNDVNQTPLATGASFATTDGYGGAPQAQAGFTFEILSGSTPVLSLSASVALTLGYSGGITYSIAETGSPALNGFALVTPAGSDNLVGYQWDTTVLDVPLGITLNPGQSASFTYISSSTTSTADEDLTCGTSAPCPQVLAYSGFGDPIGKSAGSGGVSDPYYPVFDLSLPTFDASTGMLDGPRIVGVSPELALADVASPAFIPIPASVLGPIPEPETWSLMIIGIGLAGGMLRSGAARRRA